MSFHLQLVLNCKGCCLIKMNLYVRMYLGINYTRYNANSNLTQ